MWLDQWGLPLSGSVSWYDAHGREVEILAVGAGPFQGCSEFAQVLVDQKPRSSIDKNLQLPLDVG
jgi:hypothetical protein